jgi:hypothetical protein
MNQKPLRTGPAGLLLLLLLLSPRPMVQAQIREDALRKHIGYLASDKLEGRAPGTQGEALARDYIRKEMEAYGLTPAGSTGWTQPFTYTETLHGKKQGPERKGENVLGYLSNGARYTFVIGAHYDHLGHEDGRGSSMDARPEGKIHNGADDNASGVAGLLELARHYARNGEREPVNFLFIAFSAEEAGLIGSKHFTRNITRGSDSLRAMFNMDMIGRFRDSTRHLEIGGAGTSPVWIPLSKDVNQAPAFSIRYDTSGSGPSDHASFYLQNIPAIHFFTGTHKDYHKPEDDIEKINFRGETEVLGYIIRFIDGAARLPEIPFQKTRTSERKAAAFKVTLGIMADYGFPGPGVKIDGVSPGKAAEKAGLLPGDILLKVGEFEIGDVYSYMEALSKHSKGQQVMLKVKRGKEELSRPATF